jgi:hypothetical protein
MLPCVIRTGLKKVYLCKYEHAPPQFNNCYAKQTLCNRINPGLRCVMNMKILLNLSIETRALNPGFLF